MRQRVVRLLALAVLQVAPWTAAALDGAIEINQAKALAGGITLGDTPGFPVTISSPGSYILTSELSVPSGVDGLAIDVSVIEAAIDLNGFGISRSTDVGFDVPGRGIVGAGLVENGRVHGFREGIVGARLVRRVTVSLSYFGGISSAVDVVESGAVGGTSHGIQASRVR